MKVPPKLNIANTPTPLQKVKFNGIAFYIKRDDMTGVELTGNKIRKLDYLLSKSRRNKSDYIFTCGGDQSNHCRATALAAKSIGINTKLVTTEEINQSYEGRDRAEQVKYCIKYYLEHSNISYVLLVGGLKGFFCNPDNEASWLVPARYSHLDLDGYPESKYLCDLYFADIYYDGTTRFCDWNTNRAIRQELT